MLVFIGLSLIIFAWIISSPILSIMLGIGFSLVLQPPGNNIFKKSGTKLIQNQTAQNQAVAFLNK